MGGILLALASKVMAYIWLVIAILVIVVAAIIIITLVRTINRVLPEKKDDVTRIWLNDGNGYDDWIYDNAPAYALSLTDETTSARATTIGGISFNLQYGISTIGAQGPVGWVACGTNLVPVQFSDSAGSDLYNYSFTMSGYGQSFRVTCTNGVYVTDVIDVNTNTYSVTLQWSSDLVSWESLFINPTCGVYSVENFADTNAPPERGFYRLEINTNPNP